MERIKAVTIPIEMTGENRRQSEWKSISTVAFRIKSAYTLIVINISVAVKRTWSLWNGL